MTATDWKLLLSFFRHLRQKAYQVKFERGRTVTMAMRRHERPLLYHLDNLIKVAESELQASEAKMVKCKGSWIYVVSILRKEKDFFDEFRADKELKQSLQKFLNLGA